MERESDRISLWYHTNIREKSEHHSSMFMEDFYQNIVPLYGEANESVQCELVPEDEKLYQEFTKLLPTLRTRYENDFKFSVLGAIHYIANYLVNQGFIILEFVTIKEFDDSVSYNLVSVTGEKIKFSRKNIFQFIPEDAAKEYNIAEPIKIPRDKCYIIEFPKSLGGKKKYTKFLKDFRYLGLKSPLMSFFNNNLKTSVGYDVNEHQRLHEIEMLKKSKLYNWHHRGINNKSFSSYYDVYRRLHFSKTKIILRDFIIDELKKIIEDISEKIENKVELTINGLISQQDIDVILSQWNTGELKPSGLKEII
jgi:hypothetical protein